MTTRRELLSTLIRAAALSSSGALLSACAARPVSETGGSLAQRAVIIELEKLERASGGRLGVAALNLTTGESLDYRGNERFAMCSTFKWLLAAMILKRVDRGELSLDDTRPIAAESLVHYSPITEKHAGGVMTLAALCDAAVTLSDNTAANELLGVLGGPPNFTADVRGFGDRVTRLDRMEPELNENNRGDERDTTSPVAMLGLMKTVLFGNVLEPDSVLQLRRWMIDARTGKRRLRAGFDPSWQVGNKTGTSLNDQSNDVAFAISLSQAMRVPGPLLITSYANIPEPMSAGSDAVHSSIASEVVRALAF
ncbi:MAG: class A beta-lactamase [Pseudomonadota bacterium]